MLKQLFSKPKTVESKVAFTIGIDVQVGEQTIRQTQYLTEHYVVTEVSRNTILFWPEKGERYLVDRAGKELRRMDLSQQRSQMAKLKEMVGEVAISAGDEEVEVGEHRCRRYAFQANSPALVASGEVYSARFPGLERTALQQERELDAATQPFALPLEPGEFPVSSSTRTLAQGFEQNQTTRLAEMRSGIEALDEMDRFLTYKIVG